MDLYQLALRPLLFSGALGDEETLHGRALDLLSFVTQNALQPWGTLVRSPLRARFTYRDPRLSQTLWGLNFSNPVGLAAGFDKDGVAAPIWGDLGFGFAELGTVTHQAQPGNPKPRLFRLVEDEAILNRMGFNNQGSAALAQRLQQFAAQLEHRPRSGAVTTGAVTTGAVTTGAVTTGAVATGTVTTGTVTTGAVTTGTVATGTIATGAVTTGTVATGAVTTGTIATGAVTTGAVTTGTIATGTSAHQPLPWSIPLGINLGKSKITPLEQAIEDYCASFRLLEPWGSYFVVNVSSPNTPGLRSLQATEALDPLLAALQQENPRNLPLFVKISPDLAWDAVEAVVDLAQRHHLAGLIATNTTIGREGLRTQRLRATGSLVAEEAGGISGAPLSDRSTAVVRFLWEQSQGQVPIIGVGGVANAAQAWAKISAGASLVQLYTAWIYGGPGLLRQMLQGLGQRLDRLGMATIQDAIGSQEPDPLQ